MLGIIVEASDRSVSFDVIFSKLSQAEKELLKKRSGNNFGCRNAVGTFAAAHAEQS